MTINSNHQVSHDDVHVCAIVNALHTRVPLAWLVNVHVCYTLSQSEPLVRGAITKHDSYDHWRVYSVRSAPPLPQSVLFGITFCYVALLQITHPVYEH